MSAVCVYCASSFGLRKEFGEIAFETGRSIAKSGQTLVYGGANVGLMGLVADGALSEDGQVIGVLPEALSEKEIAHTGLSKLHIVGSMHERKALMNDLSDAFISLPGGAGTMEEMFEMWTWAQLGYHNKPSGLLNIAGYYDHLIAFLDQMVQAELIKPEMREILIVETDPTRLLDRFRDYVPPKVHKWIKKGET
ncbi:LOG family protein [Flexibacterium corallicola]|uniref:LOG family protein n=1 Tax=Flexibacterium corallicola TaxID=3037259 RepID=UPI00286F66A3|nr:TIGR00730 family Rossman fold protein [Pseudovibrio sp. M1P-2-3]